MSPRVDRLNPLRTDAAIQVAHLSKRYDTVTALDDLSLEIRHGEIFGLLGPNGAGKTTLIRALMGLTAPTDGTVRVFGLDSRVQARPIRAATGYVAQHGAADVYLTGSENLHLYAALFDLPARIATRRVADVLTWAGLAGAADRLVHTYSGGMKRRLDLAISILHEPHLLVLDEPTLGLDIHTRRHLWSLIAAQQAAERTVLLTTHYLEEADQLCDRVAIISAGRMVALGTPADLRRDIVGDAHHLRITLSSTHPSTLPDVPVSIERAGADLVLHGPPDRLWRALALLQQQIGGDIREVQYTQPTLDDVFVRLTGTADQHAMATAGGTS